MNAKKWAGFLAAATACTVGVVSPALGADTKHKSFLKFFMPSERVVLPAHLMLTGSTYTGGHSAALACGVYADGQGKVRRDPSRDRLTFFENGQTFQWAVYARPNGGEVLEARENDELQIAGKNVRYRLRSLKDGQVFVKSCIANNDGTPGDCGRASDLKLQFTASQVQGFCEEALNSYWAQDLSAKDLESQNGPQARKDEAYLSAVEARLKGAAPLPSPASAGTTQAP